MGRLSKRFNQKARQASIQNSAAVQKKNDEIKKIFCLESEDVLYKSTQDESNALVLTGKKNKTPKVQRDKMKSSNVKVLSKKERKKLQRIVEQKHKKEKV